MRLRLRIERNALPTTQALWPVKDTKITVARLLQHISDTFPLESGTWGLEDYSVSVGGYECLHYHELNAVCKDEDEVHIRPLQTADVRARTLTGRHQIASDGRHLVDGIPFGRPRLKVPVRPDVTIPPRKKAKLLHREHDEGDVEDVDDDEDDEDDGDDEDFEGDDQDGSSTSLSSEDESQDSSSAISSSDSDSEVASEDGSDDEGSWAGLTNSEPSTPKRKKPSVLPNGISNSHPSIAATGSKRKRNSTDDVAETGYETKAPKLDSVLPSEGLPETKRRNARRRDTKKLNHLKALKVLPPDATLESLRCWSAENKMVPPPDPNNGIMKKSVDVRKGPLLSPETNGDGQDAEVRSSVDLATNNNFHEKLDRLSPAGSTRRKDARLKTVIEKKRQALLSAVASGELDVSREPKTKPTRATKSVVESDGENGPPEELSSKQKSVNYASVEPAVVAKPTLPNSTGMIPPAVARRSKLDLAASQRLVFGSLGVRVPKTQVERDELQKNLAKKPIKKAFLNGTGPAHIGHDTLATNAENEDQLAEAEDPDAWREKIHLTAVECCEEGVTLSTPPFPFYQRWDPQQKQSKANKRLSSTYMEGGRKKHKHGKKSADYAEAYDRYNEDGAGDGLNYDDSNGDEYWEEGALLGVEDAEEVEKDDRFPPLPDNLDHLQVLDEDAARNDDYIAFTELACDESTGWAPTMVARTAQIKAIPSTPASGDLSEEAKPPLFVLELSLRDQKLKVFDDEGNRVYSKFEMPDDDDEGAEDGAKREVAWSELGQVRLLLRREEADAAEA